MMFRLCLVLSLFTPGLAFAPIQQPSVKAVLQLQEQTTKLNAGSQKVDKDESASRAATTTTTTTTTSNADSLELVKMTFLGGLAPSMLFLLGILWTTMDHGRPDVEPYTLQEWSWALQGGYVDTMVSHYLRNFGI